MSVNHITLIGLSANTFKKNLASQAFEGDRPLDVIPFFNCHLLAARSSPQVEFPHPEFFILKPSLDSSSLEPPMFEYKREELEFKVFKITLANGKGQGHCNK